MKRRQLLGVAALGALQTGCTAAEFLAGLSKVAQGSQYLQSAISVAQAGADAFFRRHPSMDRETAVATALRVARQSAASLDAALATAESLHEGDLSAAREEALNAWAALKSVLDEFGIPQATPPEGGAENTSAPEPEPFELPERDKVEALLSS